VRLARGWLHSLAYDRCHVGSLGLMSKKNIACFDFFSTPNILLSISSQKLFGCNLENDCTAIPEVRLIKCWK
jgi:hypothetical protein